MRFRADADAQRELRKAFEFYEKFHWGIPSRKIIQTELEIPKADAQGIRHMVALGYLRGLIYQSTKEGEKKDQNYIHALEPALPLLCTDEDGLRLFIVGGDYRVEPRGIVG